MENVLNPKIYNRYGKLYPEVRESLIRISNEFLSTVCANSEVCIEPSDILIVGSNASYNYTPESDLDLHIVINFDLIPGGPDILIQSYYNAERTNFNNNYDFSIKGVNVEVYVEDINSSSISNGIYSVLRNEWIKLPTKLEDTPGAISKANFNTLVNSINNILVTGDSSEIKDLLDSLYLMRRESLVNEGELGNGNLVFKELRRKGLIDSLKSRYRERLSKEISQY